MMLEAPPQPAPKSALAHKGASPNSNRHRRLPSLLLLLTLAIAGPIVAGSVALLAVSASTARRISESLAQHVLTAGCDEIATEVGRQLDEAMRVSDRYARRVNDGILPTSTLAAWQRLMLDDLTTSPVVASICVGTPDNRATWLLRGSNRLELGIVTGPGSTDATEYAVQNQTAITPSNTTTPANEIIRHYQYIATQRPWYTLALSSNQPTWTPVYFWFGKQSGETQTGIGYTRTLYNNDLSNTTEPVAALVIDVTLGGLSDFLRTTDVASRGHAFIIDDQGLLVAASTGNVVSSSGDRLTLAQAGTPAAAALAAYTTRGKLTIPEIAFDSSTNSTSTNSTNVTIPLSIKGDPARGMIRSISPAPGIHWRVIAVLPESAFLSEAKASERRAIILAAIAAFVSLLVAVTLARRLAAPVRTLAEHVARIGAGDLSSRVTIAGTREFAMLADETNAMAKGLAHRMELERALAVAQEVQQSLLPACDPTTPGLEIAGRTRYCDETGGDYFDFIDVAQSHDASAHTMIAVGDVMGHGIASALLMATARAALRSHAPEHADLADLLRRVNRVLAADARHDRFMTLALVVIDPTSGRVRWASAGHDPTIVYYAARNEFTELEGSGIPLGIMEDAEYAECSASGLVSGDVLIIGTDGIWESRNPEGIFFGKDRLRDIIKQTCRQSSATIASTVQRDLVAFRGREGSEDDVTFVVIKIS